MAVIPLTFIDRASNAEVTINVEDNRLLTGSGDVGTDKQLLIRDDKTGIEASLKITDGRIQTTTVSAAKTEKLAPYYNLLTKNRGTISIWDNELYNLSSGAAQEDLSIWNPLTKEMILITVLGGAIQTTAGSTGTLKQIPIWNVKTHSWVNINVYDGKLAITTSGPIPGPGVLFWNKLGDNAEVTTSEVGPNLAWVGTPAYAPCKFGNGIVTSLAANVGEDTFSPAPWELFTVQFHWKPDIASGDTTPGTQCYLVDIIGDSSPRDQVLLRKIQSGTNDRWNIFISINGSTRVNYNFSPTTSYAAGEIIHVAFNINEAGGDGNRCAMWVNEVSQVLFSATTDLDWTADGADSGIFFGVDKIAGSFYGRGVIDNPSFLNYIKTDFSDRNNEVPS